MSPNPFRKVAEQVVYRGSLITVALATFSGPDGSTFDRDVVHHPGAVSVVAVDGEEVLLVRQYRAAVEKDVLEVVAGKRDVDGEAIEVTAARELEEEVGMRAGRLQLLAEFYNSPGFTDEHSYVFLATELTACAPSAQGEEEQHMTIERHRLADVPALIASRELVDGKSIIGLCLARDALAVAPPQ